MDKKEEFKQFVKDNPGLVENVRNNKMTWQKYYELYDLFGNDKTKWEPYLGETDRAASKVSLASIAGLLKKVDMNSVQKHVNTAQKAINLFQEISAKPKTGVELAKGPSTLRPINKIFED